jgi:hypothetical protein
MVVVFAEAASWGETRVAVWVRDHRDPSGCLSG